MRLGYAHAVHKAVLLLATLEWAHSAGPQDNPYRGTQIPNVVYETHPLKRNRFAVFGEARWFVPRAKMTVEPRYRFSVDDWGIKTHMAEARLHFRFARNWSLRLRYRFYVQSQSFFWRDDNGYTQNPGGCTRDHPERCASADPKMNNFHSSTPGIQLTWHLDGLARFRGLHWLEGAWLEATYNHIFQTSRYGNARMGSLAFSLAF